jgi:saccharopine dehydrogenase-like NADP-dependent oxidoreductase
MLTLQVQNFRLKHIVLFGAGKSSLFLIEYLVDQLIPNNWQLTVVDADLHAAQQKTKNAQGTTATAINVENADERKKWIAAADIVISLLPPSLHFLVAQDCLHFEKNLLTASYVDQRLENLRPEIENKGLLFLCEMGLDPGIDHMSAMRIIHRLRQQGATITSFRSHCGGLVAPESDDNPWRYKISWNPRNVVLAGKAGAVYRENNEQVTLDYPQLFSANKTVNVPQLGALSWYPNRDSLSYISAYGLENAETFIRTTLRYPEFCFGWKNIIQLGFTDENIQYDTDGMSLKDFFRQHLNKHGFSEWIEKQLTARFVQTKMLLEKLQQLLSVEELTGDEGMNELREFMMVDGKGKLMDVNLEEVKTKAAATVAGQMHEANLAIKQLFYLGMDDEATLINKGRCSAADVLQFILEKKLPLDPSDRDMVVMLHEIDYTLNNTHHSIRSSLVVKGENSERTAMAKTVGLPLGIAAKLILKGDIILKGLHIPIVPEIYEPVLNELKAQGINFSEH